MFLGAILPLVLPLAAACSQSCHIAASQAGGVLASPWERQPTPPQLVHTDGEDILLEPILTQLVSMEALMVGRDGRPRKPGLQLRSLGKGSQDGKPLWFKK